MKRKLLLLTLLVAFGVPMAALAQVERTVTVYNGKDKECHVPLYGNVTRMDDLSISQFIMDKSVLQAAGLAGKEITKMALHLANPVPDSYEWTTKRRTVVTLAEVDASELDGGFIQDMTNPTNVFADYLDAHGETMEISFGTPFTYSGEKNLLVQFREEYMYYFGYDPFGTYRLPMYYGVYKTGASYWRQVRASNNYSTVSSLNCHFVPKTTFTYLTEANWANTKAPKNARTISNYSIGNNINSFNYYIRMDWDASDNYTGNYQVLCVPRGTSSLDWSNAATTSDTFYLFEGLQKNTAYDLYVRAKSGLFYTSNAAMASASTPFYPANLDEGPLTFDFNSQTMPNGLDFDCSIPYYLSAYGSLGYYNLGTTYNGATAYNNTPPITITLPEMKFTNATNGLMLEFDLKGAGQSYYNYVTGELQVKIYDYGYDVEVFSQTVSASIQQHHYTFRLPDLDNSNYHIYKLSFDYAGGSGFGLDNIVVRKAPNIMPPYNLAASEITPTSATISWTDDNTNSHTFDLVYRQKGYSNDPNVWQHYVEGVSNPYTLTGLTPYTDYEVKVKTITSAAFEDSEILEFSTLCTPAEVPYNEPFTSLTTLPTDWRVNVPEYAGVVTEVGNGLLTMHNTVTEVTEYYYGYPYTYTLYSNFSAYIILPYFYNLGSLQLSFKAGRTQGTMESLRVGVVADPKNYASFTEIGTATLTDNVNGEVYHYNLVNNAVQNGHIVIRFTHSESNDQSIWFDDFSVQQYAAPTDLTVLTTNNSATLSWNAGAAAEWEVRYKATSASNYGTPIAVTESTYTLTGLTANTAYTAQVRAKYGDNLYSAWNDGDFGSFKTLMQEAVVMNAENASYYEDFESGIGNWLFLNASTNKWKRFSYTKSGYDYSYGLRITNSADNVLNPKWEYQTRRSYTINGQTNYLGTPATSFAVKTFTLSEGHYEFNYRRAVKGVTNNDYMRVVLVPAETELVAGTLPDGFDYQSTPNGWFSLDYGEQLSGNPLNDYQWIGISPIELDVYSGGTYEPGNYMIVVLWNNPGAPARDGQNPPGAIDNVSVTWSPVIDAPGMALQGTTDTEATLTLIAPDSGLTPTSYEVQYMPEADYLNNNSEYDGAPMATFNVTGTTQSATLTGLTPNTGYCVRLRSVYSANGNSIYSDWENMGLSFTTKYPRPTNLAVVNQTSSWVYLMWTPAEMELPEGQYVHYWYQLTTDPSEWGEYIEQGLVSYGLAQNLTPGTYRFHAKTAVYDESSCIGESDWSEPITFTIAPWTDPVTIFPLTQDFEEYPDHFADGLTLDGDYEHLDLMFYTSEEPTPGDSENGYKLRFHSCNNKTASLVLPPLRPSTTDALVSFWWYHDNAGASNEGVIVEYSSNGSSWQSFGNMIPRYAAQTGWVKYQQVVPALGPGATYIRLRFIASNSNAWENCCYLDDLTVYAFKSYQPYISYVAANVNSATITLYDYAIENDYHSSAFEVQYREYRDPGETQEEWVTYPYFENEEPYTFENYLTLNGLLPATLYEFRVRARVSYGGYDFPWSNYCEPYRQWTDDSMTVTSQLASGWNWWAPRVETSVEDLQTALGEHLSQLQLQDNDPEGLIHLGQMVRLQTNTACEFTLTGMVAASVAVPITLGVNWFGYTGATATVSSVFGNGFTPATGDKIISQDEGFVVFNGTEWEGTLLELVPGQGYVYVSTASESKTLTF